jgi:uncharacterized protein
VAKYLAHIIQQHPLMSFFAMTYAFSWGLWFLFQPLYLSGEVLAAPGIMLGIFGPALVGMVLSAIQRPGQKQGNRKTALMVFILVWPTGSLLFYLDQVINEGRSVSPSLLVASTAVALLPAFVLSIALYSSPEVRHQLSTLVKPKGDLGYYLLAVVLFPLLWGLGIFITRALGMEVRPLRYPSAGIGLVGMILRDLCYTLFYTGFSEEPGWRGYALPRLQARWSPLSASLILGVLWAVWHAPARLGGFEAKSAVDTIVEWVFVILISIILTWLYNRTQQSLLSTVLLHSAMNVTSHVLPLTPGACLLLVAFLLFAIFRDRMWQRNLYASLQST